MTFVSRQYLLADFDKIADAGIEYTLDASVINIIQQISNQVGAPEYIRTPQFEEKHTNDSLVVKRYGRQIRQEKECDIKFCVVPQRPNKDGVNVYTDIIRKLLNKITTKTYNDLFPTLIQELDKIVDIQDDYKTTISSLVLSIVSETSFYSDMYASLYASLLEKYEFLWKELDA